MKPQRSEAMAVNIDPQKWNFHPSMCSIALTHKEHPMTPEEVIRLAAVDVRERPEDELVIDLGQFALESMAQGPVTLDEVVKAFVAERDRAVAAEERIRQLEQERDEAAEIIRQAKSLMSELYNWIEWWPNGPETWDATEAAIDAFLAKHPQPAKEQVE
jgi:hypothetical protein